jgi:hypothetical protein
MRWWTKHTVSMLSLSAYACYRASGSNSSFVGSHYSQDDTRVTSEAGTSVPGGDLSNTTIFVGGLSDLVTEDMLHEVLLCLYVRVHMYIVHTLPRSYAYILGVTYVECSCQKRVSLRTVCYCCYHRCLMKRVQCCTSKSRQVEAVDLSPMQTGHLLRLL